MTKEGLTEKTVFEQGPEGGDQVTQADNEKRVFQKKSTKAVSQKLQEVASNVVAT